MSKGRIAVIIPAVNDALDQEFISGIHHASLGIGYDTLVFTGIASEFSESYTKGENNIYQLPLYADVDGVIIAANRFHDDGLKKTILECYERSGIPTVSAEEEYKSITGVFLEQGESIGYVTEHLIKEHSYKEILCLTGPKGNVESEERAMGYVRTMKNYGLYSTVIYGDFWRNSANALAEEIATGKRPRPEAIVCTNDIMAMALCQRLPEFNIKVPDDIAVTGYDGSVYTLLTKPPITTVCGGDGSLGALCVKTLAEKMGIGHNIETNFQHLRICGSCGCHNEQKEREYLLSYTEKLLNRQFDRRSFMYSNYIARMSDCESIPKFASVLDSLRYMMSDCKAINVCVCEDWRKEHPDYRKSGYSDNMQLIYSENQPGQLTFPIHNLLPVLNQNHEPQLWVFSSIHYFDKIIGYIATLYDSAEQFKFDEHYTGWCDAVANGLDIVIKKSNTEYIWQKLEEKNMADIYTGLYSRRGFISNISAGDSVVLFSFPKRYKDTQYFVPMVSAVLRSDDRTNKAMYFGETVFGVSLRSADYSLFPARICRLLSELGIYITENELNIIIERMDDDSDVDGKLSEMYSTLTERATPKSSEAYSKIFSELRKEMKYSPQYNWSVTEAAIRTGLSGSHFQRLYKKHFGVPFTEELITFRMERAKYLLKNTDMSVQRIAEECGYTNSAHFMRQFKDRENISAGRYRREER